MRARRRAAVAVAIAAEQRAAELSEGTVRRAGRVLRAAEMALELGRSELGLRLLGVAESLNLAAEERTRLSWLREIYDNARGFGAASSIAETGQRMQRDGHLDLAVKFLLAVVATFWWGSPEQESRADIVAAAEGLPLQENEPALLAILAHADPVGRGAQVIDRVSRLTPGRDGSSENVSRRIRRQRRLGF